MAEIIKKKYKAIVIKTGTLIDGQSGLPLNDSGVLIEKNIITKTAPWNQGGPWPEGDDVLQMESRAAIPGLINIHVHVTSLNDLKEYIRHGITSIRDVGTDPYAKFENPLFFARKEIEAGRMSGPRIFSYGFIMDGPKSIFPRLTVPVSTEDEAFAEVDRQAGMGVDGIKLYYKLSPRVAAAVIKRAAVHNLPTAGHIGMLIGGVDGARMGINSIEHLISFVRDLFPSFIHPAVTLMVKCGFMDDPSKGLDQLFKMWRDIDPEEKNIRRIAREFKETGAAFHPTIVALERLTRIGGLLNTCDPRFEKMRKHELTAELYKKTIPEKWNDKMTRRGRECIEGMLRFINVMYREGVPVGIGTDDSVPFVFPGESMHDEMAFLARAEIRPVDVIKMATSRNAQTLRRSDLGVIAEGKTADIVLLNRDPSADISAAGDIKCVIKNGEIVYTQI